MDIDIYAIPVRDDGTTINDIKSREQAFITLFELDKTIADIRKELDDSWADYSNRGISADPDWLADTKAELREKTLAKRVLQFRIKQWTGWKEDCERMRQNLLIECLREKVTEEQWLIALVKVQYKLAALKSGTDAAENCSGYQDNEKAA